MAIDFKNLLKQQWQKEVNAWNRIRFQPRKTLKQQTGIAMMVALAALLLIVYLAMELTYESNVEYTVNSQNLNRLKAYYAAKSGLDLALLRVKIFQKVSSQLGDQLGGNAGMLDEIWRFPFAWPLPPMDELSEVDQDAMKTAVKDSFMDSSYLTTIEDEGSKIDLHDLVSKSKVLRDQARKQILNIFENQKKNDRDFEQKYSSLNFEELVNQINDFMSSTTQSANGSGDKRGAFAELNSEAQVDIFPPNRAFRTMAELRFIPLMTDDLYQLLEPRITIYGMKGINPNLASKEVLLSLDPGLTTEVVDELIKRRTTMTEGGPYKNAEDFWSYAQTKGARLEGDTAEIPLIFDAITNFRIRSTGEFAGATREISVIVMDLDRIALKVAEQIKKEEDEEKKKSGDSSGQQGQSEGQGGQPGKTATKQKPNIPKGPPRIVWWSEK